MKPFQFSATPQLHFGAGKISTLAALVKRYGTRVLLITGARSFTESVYGKDTLQSLGALKGTLAHATIASEPSPSQIDTIVRNLSEAVDVVIAIGGGSVVDAGKAVAAMIPLGVPVKDYLEGVGTKQHPGTKVPFIAVPTTAGTGSEATKNAVLSETGEHGYKKSLRHDNFVPDIAIVDPVLMVECPPAITAASGMDAFTQLLESYLSVAASPLTDALALEGLQRISQSLPIAFQNGQNLTARTDMALAAYLSGITLANAGLGQVHGFASAVGGYFPIPHGVICSALMHACNRATVQKLRSDGDKGGALKKYATAGKIFAGNSSHADEYYVDFLLERIGQWTHEMNIPSLAKCGVATEDFSRIVSQSDSKNNPVPHTAEEMLEILHTA